MEEDFVYIDEYKLLGSNFYWSNFEAKGITKEEILSVGLRDNRVQVNKKIIDKLVSIDNIFKKVFGYRLYIKEGYRSEDLYKLIYKKRVAKFGKEETDKLLNMKDMPHSLGCSVDVALWDVLENREVFMRRGDDGVDALFIDFYKNKKDDESKKYQKLQESVIEIMKSHGFQLGSKREYFHFDYKKS